MRPAKADGRLAAVTNRRQGTAFTPAVRRLQERAGGRESHAGAGGRRPADDRSGARETQFIAERDGFFLATVSETGWPYVRFRGGPPGFARALDGRDARLDERSAEDVRHRGGCGADAPSPAAR